MTAPTEQEIREAVSAALDASTIDMGAWVHDMAQGSMVYSDPDERGPSYTDGLWDNLRPSEAARLDNLLDGVMIRMDDVEREVTAKITEAIVEAALTFAREYPDAPRARKVTAAA